MSELYEFIDKVGKSAQKYYPKYQILPSLCIAQALLESNKADYRKGNLKLSGLATECHNYFGMKWREGCGCSYKEYWTKEQKPTGEVYDVLARFRKYPTIDAGIEGYFKFLDYKRYANLKGVKDYKKACELIRADGWATSLTYTQNLIKRIEDLRLYEYDNIEGNGSAYLKVNNYTGASLVEGLIEAGVDSSYSYRYKLAVANGINTYRGSADQNTYLLNLLKAGTLKRA